MKKFLKIAGSLWVLLFIALFCVIKVLENKKPSVDSTPITLKTDSLTLVKGEYLAKHVAACMDCHSTRDFSLFSAPTILGTEGKGGEGFLKEHGFPGDFYAANLSPSHLGNLSDEAFYQALTSGIGSNGFGLFPVMPWPKYAKSDKEDILAIMSYIRTLSPIENLIPESKPRFPMTFIRNLMPSEPKHKAKPDTSDAVAYGEYLANMASCSSCHSQQKMGKPLEGLEYAGGFTMKFNGGQVNSSNITPDKETGIGSWSKEAFVAKFKIYADSNYVPHKVNSGDPQTLMPWKSYSGMTESDLGAIYDFLMTIQPVKNKVDIYSK